MLLKEYALHVQISDYLCWVLNKDCYYTSVENSNHMGGMIGRANQVKDKRKGVKTGFPDLLIIYKGQIYLLEIKIPGKDPTPVQKQEHIRIRQAGGIVEVVHSIDEIRNFFNKYNIPTRESNYV